MRRAGERALGLWGLILATGSCAIRVPVTPPEGDAGGPRSAVARFLEAANRRDLDAMARLFGTDGGAVAETGGGVGCGLRRLASWLAVADACPNRREIELRMHAISAVLRHDDFEVVSEERVPGRERPATRVSVAVRRGERIYRDVGFLAIRGPSGWLVEAVELERITGRWGGPARQPP